MAKRTAITQFLREDRNLIFTIKNRTETSCVDITTWTISFMLKRKVSDVDADALLEKTTTSGGIVVAGVYNSDPSANTQTATVNIDAGDTDAYDDGETFYELKRTDVGAATVLAYGPLVLLRGVHRDE